MRRVRTALRRASTLGLFSAATLTGISDAGAQQYLGYGEPARFQVAEYERSMVRPVAWDGEGEVPPIPAGQAEPAIVAEPAPVVESAAPDCGCDGGGQSCGQSCGCGVGYARARCCDPWYIAIAGGYQNRETVHEVGDPSTFIAFDGGFSMNAALGYRFDHFRVEAEYSFMNNTASEAGSGGLSSATPGNLNLRAFMFNIYHDIEIDGWMWKPYVGAGIGIYQSEINGLFPEFFQTVGGGFATNPLNCTSDTPFAYQFRAGASRPIGDRCEFYTGYRYFHGEELTFSSAPFASGAAPTFSPDGAWTHGIELGLRVKF